MPVWYIYRDDGKHVGPVPVEEVAEAILAGTLPPNVWIAAPGGGRWARACDVPAIAALVEGVPTRRLRRPASAKAFAWPAADPDDRETVPTAPPLSGISSIEGVPATERTPPSSSSPIPPTVESSGTEPRRRTRGA